jgi:hypothetical protein
MTTTPRDIAARLPEHGLTSEWANTGGGVFNLEIPVTTDGDVIAYVGISDNGEWTAGDYATPADAVSVVLYDALTGDPFDPAAWTAPAEMWHTDDLCTYARTTDDAVTQILAAVAHALQGPPMATD